MKEAGLIREIFTFVNASKLESKLRLHDLTPTLRIIFLAKIRQVSPDHEGWLHNLLDI